MEPESKLEIPERLLQWPQETITKTRTTPLPHPLTTDLLNEKFAFYGTINFQIHYDVRQTAVVNEEMRVDSIYFSEEQIHMPGPTYRKNSSV